MIRKLLLFVLLAAATGCGDPKLKVGLNVGLAGASVGSMAASEVRQSRAARDRRFETRVAAQKAIALGQVTPEMLRAALDSLAADNSVAVVVSRFLGQESLDAARAYNNSNMPYLSITPLPDGFVSANGPGFSLVPGHRKQARFLAELADRADQIVIVHIADAYGATLATEVVEALRERGLSTLAVRSYQQSWDEPRVVALGTDVAALNPTLLYFLGRAPSLELVWQPFREAVKEVRVVGSDLVESRILYANNAGHFTGLQYVRYLDPRSSDPRMRDLHDRYDWWLSQGEMTGEAVLVYDAMMLVGEGMRQGARTRDEFREYFSSLGRSRPAFTGVGGDIAFGDDGEVAREFELAEVTYQGISRVER